MNSLPKYLKDHLLITSPLIGLSDEHLSTIKNIIPSLPKRKNILDVLEELQKIDIPEGVALIELYYKEKGK